MILINWVGLIRCMLFIMRCKPIIWKPLKNLKRFSTRKTLTSMSEMELILSCPKNLLLLALQFTKWLSKYKGILRKERKCKAKCHLKRKQLSSKAFSMANKDQSVRTTSRIITRNTLQVTIYNWSTTTSTYNILLNLNIKTLQIY